MIEKAVDYRDSEFKLGDIIKISCYEMLYGGVEFLRNKKIELNKNKLNLEQVLETNTKSDGYVYYKITRKE